ncbi:MAG: GAF domain-containing protein [Chloroflexi bacterium]|nr:GAF domain-containing protein [Chloroflexota bacterium]
MRFNLYRLLFFAAGGGLLAWNTWQHPPQTAHLGAGLLLAVLAAAQALLPLRLLAQEGHMLAGLTLAGALIYGAPLAGWAAALGMAAGYALRRTLLAGLYRRASLSYPDGVEALFDFGAQAASLVAAVSLAGRGGAIVNGAPGIQDFLLQAAQALVIYSVIHGLIALGDYFWRRAYREGHFGLDWLWLFLVETYTLGVALAILLAHRAEAEGWLAISGGVTLASSAWAFGLRASQLRWRRRLLHLTALNRMSLALGSALQLDDLLEVIHHQVSRTLEVENLYVALLHVEDGQLWYPLAVKHSERAHWPSRAMEDRLTDRVILEGKPLLLACRAWQEIARIGLPPGEGKMSAWMGAPLSAGGKVIGCLGVFSYAPQVEFTSSDLEWLVTVCGQVGAAVQNALLYQQAQQRAAQLETLNKVATALTASLDFDEVLAQVCRSVTQVVGGQYSAIYLLEQGEDSLWLAHAHQLSEGFIQANLNYAFAPGGRARCLETGAPYLVEDVSRAAMEQPLAQALANENIRACGDFPLFTPGGKLGFLSIYYTEPKVFSAEETRLAQTFAAQAALAVANARLHANIDRALDLRVQQLSILEAVGRELAAAVRSESLFEIILSHAMQITHSHGGCLCLLDGATRGMSIKAWQGYPAAPEAARSPEVIYAEAVRMRRIINLPDVTARLGEASYPGGFAGSLLCAPLVHEERVWGLLTVESRDKAAYSAGDEGFISQLATQAALAVVNAALYAQAQQRLSQLSAVLNSVGEGILVVDAAGQVILANQAITPLLGFAADEPPGWRLLELSEAQLAVLGCTLHEAKANLASLALGHAPDIPKKTVRVSMDGFEHIKERSCFPVLAADGRATGMVIVLHDVTEEYEIARTREVITETLVHDLRSPVSTMLGALDVIGEVTSRHSDGDPEMVQEALHVARRGGRRVLGMIESLLEIARLQSDKMDVHVTSINLRSLIAVVMNEMLPQALEMGIYVYSQAADDLPLARADRGKTARVLTNLLDNALKFTPVGGEVCIAAGRRGEHFVCIQVIDSGPGVPEEYRERIFERFTQVPGVRGRRRGSGLGLAFCRLAVEAQGGKVWVEPAPEGGSIFTFTLPVAAASDNPAVEGTAESD